MNFHETRMGHVFFEHQLPQLIRAINALTAALGKLPLAEEAGICPICGGELEYGSDITLDEGGVYEWTCLGCGATGKEGYNKVFDQHYDVRDADGKPFPAPAK